MSRIGRTAITIPAGVTLEIQADQMLVKGPKGQLTMPTYRGIKVKVEDNNIVVERSNDNLQTKAYHGLVRSLLNNYVLGVTSGYKKTLKLIGTGYRVQQQGQGLSLSVGFSHPVLVSPMEGVTFKVEGNDTIIIEGIDKQKVGQMIANIRSVRPPEPYKGKGIRYEDEVVIRKQGKAAA